MSPVDALVLDLDTRAGLCIARTLGAQGYRVAVAAQADGASGMRTRYAAARAWLPPAARDFEAYADGVVSFAARVDADTILTSTDTGTAALDARREALAGVARPALAEPGPFALASSKAATIDLAQELGVPVPRSHAVHSAGEGEDVIEHIGLPAVLKPSSSWLRRGSGGERLGPVYLESKAQATAAVARVTETGEPALLQELATGRRETVKLFRVDGRVVGRLAMLVERCWPPLGGSSCMRVTIDPPSDVLAYAELIVDAAGLDGYSEVEFRRDGRGRPLLMEINPRLSQSVEVAVRAGVDFPRMQLEWARGGSVPEVHTYAVGHRVGWLAGDGRVLAAAVVGGPPPRPPLRETVTSIGVDYLVRRSRIEGLDVHDLRPGSGALAFTLRSCVRWLRRSRRAE
jgi:biotin carboxylase